MRATKLLALVFGLIVLIALPAFADNCTDFDSLTCSNGMPNNVQFAGTGTTGQSVNILLGSNTFSVNLVGNAANNFSGDSLIILAAAPNGLTGSINGVSFSSLQTFPLTNATGAINDTWAGLGISASNVAFGFANLGLVSSTSTSLTASGVGQGTIFYALLVNSDGQILYRSSNSESGVLGGTSTVTPEPASLTLLGTGLAALAGLVRRKAARS